LVSRAQDWLYSTFHLLATGGTYAVDWGGDVVSELAYDGCSSGANRFTALCSVRPTHYALSM